MKYRAHINALSANVLARLLRTRSACTCITRAHEHTRRCTLHKQVCVLTKDRWAYEACSGATQDMCVGRMD